MAPVTALRTFVQPSPVNGSAETARQIAAFVRGHSIAAARLSLADLRAFQTALTPRTSVYLNAGRRVASELIETAAQVRAIGLEPVPHIAARDLASAGALDELLARLAERASVRRVLVIAGDRDCPAGPYAGAIEVVESGLLQRHGIAEAGIAAYPEGHPRISPQVLDRALAAKIEAATQTGLAVHIVTQFGFDADAILRWLARLRDLGIEQPVRIGVAGPTRLPTLLCYAQRCGVRASPQGLMRQAGLLKHLVGTHAPDSIIRPLAEACTGGRFGRVGLHFYSFGGAAAAGRWAAAATAGRIVLDRAGGFGVEPA